MNFKYSSSLFYKSILTLKDLKYNITVAKELNESINELNTNYNFFSDDSCLEGEYSQLPEFNDFEKLEEIKVVVESIYNEIDKINNELDIIKNNMCELDPYLSKVFDVGYNDYVQFHLNNIYEKEGMYALYEFIKENIKNVDNLNLTDLEKEFLEEVLKYGENKEEYNNMNWLEKAGNGAGVFVVSFGSGVLSVGEKIIDGGIFLVGGAVSLGALIIDDEAADNIFSSTRKVIGYDVSNNLLDESLNLIGFNSIIATGECKKAGFFAGEVAGDVALAMINVPLVIDVTLEALEELGNFTEENANNLTLTNEEYALGAVVNAGIEAAGKYVVFNNVQNVINDFGLDNSISSIGTLVMETIPVSFPTGALSSVAKDSFNKWVLNQDITTNEASKNAFFTGVNYSAEAIADGIGDLGLRKGFGANIPLGVEIVANTAAGTTNEMNK